MNALRCACCLWLACLASPLHAQVFEIGRDGDFHEVSAMPENAIAGFDALPAMMEINTTATTSDACAMPARFAPLVSAAAERYALSPQLLETVARTESCFRADAVSPAGAIGLMQLMPGTARELGVDPRDPAQNLLGGAAYLRQQLDAFDGDLQLALAAYNAGGGAVARHGGIPPFAETREYVRRNLERIAATTATDFASTFASTGEPQ